MKALSVEQNLNKAKSLVRKGKELEALDLYDLIIIDTIWHEFEINEEQYQSLKDKYMNNLNPGGVLYIPMLKKWDIKN